MLNMKLFFLSLLVGLIGLTGCSSEQKFVIDGTLKGYENKTLFLQKFEDNSPVNMDSVKVGADGSFKLVANIPFTDYYRLMIDDNNAFVFIADSIGELHIEVNGKLDHPEKIEGQEDTRLMQEYGIRMDAILLKRDSIEALAQQGIPQEQLMSLMQAFSAEALQYIHGFVDKNTGSPAVMVALNHLDPTIDMPYFIKAKKALGERMRQSNYYKSLELQIAQVNKQAEMQTEMEQQQEAMLAVGKPAPEISLPDPSGKVRSLKELRGKVVLIDFWASWCGPCRQESPNVVAAYKRFKNKGFEIFSVSLDKGKEAWVNAIREDGLNWLHVSDLQYWNSQAAADYGVTSIPFTVLLDKNGNILAKNLRGEELMNELEELL